MTDETNATVTAEHRQLALNTMQVTTYLTGGMTHRDGDIQLVAQALANAEARGAAKAEAELARLESALAFLDDHASLIDPRDEDVVYEPSRAIELAGQLGWIPADVRAELGEPPAVPGKGE